MKKENFQKKVVTGKTLFFVIVPFCTHHSPTQILLQNLLKGATFHFYCLSILLYI